MSRRAPPSGSAADANGGSLPSDERAQFAHKLFSEHDRHAAYIKASTIVMSLLPISYGILTFVFGDELWGSSSIYSTALQVPWAPQSWGMLFFVLGVLNVWFALSRRDAGIAICSVLVAVVLAMFMVTFLTEVFTNDNVGAMPPAAVYGVFAIAFMNRARLAWTSRQAE
jgi:hypothetical protein